MTSITKQCYIIYAILNSPAYRSRYADFLQYDYPRIPFIYDVEKFKTLCKLGKLLTETHLLENSQTVLNVSYPVTGNDIVSKIMHKDNKLFINDIQYFEGVTNVIYNAIFGGHQVVKKWLVARNNRKLEYNDIVYLRKMLNAIAFSLEIQKEIDETIGEFPTGDFDKSTIPTVVDP